MFRAILMMTVMVAVAACERTATPPVSEGPISPDIMVDPELETVHSWLSSGEQPVASPASAAGTVSGGATLPPVEEMIHGLEQRLENEPDDRKGWSLLARSYAYVGRLGDARRAAANAVMLGDDAESLERQIAAAHEGAL